MKYRKYLYLLTVAFFGLNAQTAYKVCVSENQEPMMTGKYAPTWESLAQYETPDWFRDAKFGIWAHWGPQCVEGSGDWMARSLYIEGSPQYKYHLENYGHPSEVGFKDILPHFKAENWNPDSLVALYKKIGARYFFALGNHHDNFDLWDSKYQQWNSKNIGPKRDILAEWAEACRKNDLPFGVSIHADHAWIWYETSKRYDRYGDKMGVPYDGHLTKADGKGKWWDGLDPQDLYAQNHSESYANWADDMLHKQWEFGNGASMPTQEYVTNFYNRTLDMINRYNPDLIYFDANILPLYPISDAGLKIASHFYNHNLATHNGDFSAVIFGKALEKQHMDAIVWDVERGAPNQIAEKPWQTCTCLGDWHYNTNTYNNGWYKSAAQVVKMLADVVSKNGNLLLSVPLRANGTFDEKEAEIIDGIGEWMAINGDAIYSTRPWVIFGEGPIANADIDLPYGKGFNEWAYTNATSEEIRFTQTPKDLFAITLAWPENNIITIKTLASNSKIYPKKIKEVELLGYGKVKFSRTADGLTIKIPADAPQSLSPVLRISK